MKIVHPVIKDLLNQYKELSLVSKIKSVLDYDLNVSLPVKGAQGRGEQSAYLAEMMTKLWRKKNFLKDLEKANAILPKLNIFETAIVRNLNHANKYYSKVPPEIISNKEKITSQAFVIWNQAKIKNSFKDFLPSLKEIIQLNQTIAEYLGYEENLYDALLDQFEPELTASFCMKQFDQLKQPIIRLLNKIQSSKTYTRSAAVIDNKQRYIIADQKRLAQHCMVKMGYDFAAGRTDQSPHPFTAPLNRYDVRVTNHFNELDFRTSYLACMHETGHALYEQGIDTEYTYTPLENGISYGIHEALSRFWENMIGKNPHFLKYLTPILQSFYPEPFQNTTENDIIRIINTVHPSLIRIEADEVTYSLHIILRFELENALLNNKIKPEDAAEAWNAKSKEFFGISPITDSEGILQDVHWSYGAFGYFPSYALGNLYGAQFLKSMEKDLIIDDLLSKGKLEDIRLWLQENIHQYGSLYLPKELLKKVTGESLNHQYFIDYLTNKYSQLYF